VTLQKTAIHIVSLLRLNLSMFPLCTRKLFTVSLQIGPLPILTLQRYCATHDVMASHRNSYTVHKLRCNGQSLVAFGTNRCGHVVARGCFD
jgi:hypothetical protein